jgi:hypothetical protein
MTIYTCNDHKNAAVCFTDRDCPLCAAIEYHGQSENRIEELEGRVQDLKDEIVTLKDEE